MFGARHDCLDQRAAKRPGFFWKMSAKWAVPLFDPAMQTCRAAAATGSLYYSQPVTPPYTRVRMRRFIAEETDLEEQEHLIACASRTLTRELIDINRELEVGEG